MEPDFGSACGSNLSVLPSVCSGRREIERKIERAMERESERYR
jgi:hypothetical protein